MSDTPWHRTTLTRRPPCGLRECVLKVNYMEHYRALRFVRLPMQPKSERTLFDRVVEWRLNDPKGFEQLLAAMNLDGLVKRHKS